MFGIKNTSVDAILASFTKTIADLSAIETIHQQEAQAKNEKSKSLIAQAAEHSAEASRARTIASKISTLISADK